MKKVSFLVATALMFSMASCDNATEEVVTEEIEMHDHNHDEEEEDHHHHDADDEELVLNDGERWVINDEMKPHLSQQEEIIAEYIAAKSDNYAKLAEDLKTHNASLIKSCTMDGKSHDELHKWLHPHIDLLGDLGKAESVDEANEVIEDLNESFETFHAYFQ